jgi:NAD(P)-dependent dehydrogenase (short-subunit alcohol dehydrogenase family)
MSDARNVLITGASSGFGSLTARTLLERGHTVFATMRGVEGKNADAARELAEFADDKPGTLHTLELDVTSEESVDRCIKQALELGQRIDVVVNNAGVAVGGYAEAFSVEQYQQLFDVNLFGVQRVNRAVLPSMREAGSGLLLHVSSVMGRVVIPFAAPYTATKYALEGYAESCRYELARTGVDVAIVEPGGFRTGIDERMMGPADVARSDSYGDLADAPKKMWAGFMELLHSDQSPDPQLVADTIVELIEMSAGERPLRTVVDPLLGGEVPATVNKLSDQMARQLLEGFGMGDSA